MSLLGATNWRVAEITRDRVLAAPSRLWVYGRARQPCVRCTTPIRRRLQGELARATYWCPRCQPPRPGQPVEC